MQINDVHLLMDRESGRPRGSGFVEFTDAETLVEALKYNGEVQNRFLLPFYLTLSIKSRKSAIATSALPWLRAVVAAVHLAAAAEEDVS